MTIFETIRQIVADESGMPEEKIKPEATFVSLGLDSLEMASLLVDLEDMFGIEIPDDQASELLTLRDLVNYVQSLQ